MSAELSTRYLGLKLRTPLVAAASPVTQDLDRIARLDQEGVGAIVLPSLFEEQLEHDERTIHELYEFGTESFAEAISYLPEMHDYKLGPESYLAHLREAKRNTKVPVIASLNGHSQGGWVSYAKKMQDAGADALELNIHFVPTQAEATSEQVENQYLELVRAVRSAVSLPLAVKIGPYFSALVHFAGRLAEAGANGLVLFNRIVEPDINLESLEIEPRVNLSDSSDLRLSLRWIAILKGQVKASLAATTGAHTAEDVAKLMLAGADVVQLASSLLSRGPAHVGTLLRGLREWLEQKEYDSVEQLKGSLSLQNCSNPWALERGNYMKALQRFTGPAI
ncbi:MAG: dihydroorotate dehydrogenase-like protein [Planctomycetota bacterium]